MKELQTFYIGVKGVIKNKITNKILVLSKKGGEGEAYWDIPGGRMNVDETIKETLVRELNEEILNMPKGFIIKDLLNAYKLSHLLKDGKGLMLLFYLVEADLSEIQISDEHNDFLWVDESNIDDLTNNPNIYIESGYLDAIKLAMEVKYN